MIDWIVILGLPVLWSGVCEAARLCVRTPPQDRREKRLLILMLTPIALGAALIAAARFLPVPVPNMSWLPQALTPLDTSLVTRTVRTVHTGLNSSQWLVIAAAAVYAAGLIATAGPLIRNFIRLARIAASAEPAEVDGVVVHLTTADLPPLAWGRDRVLIPRVLFERLSPAEVILVVAHERAHLSRHDTLWFPALSLIDAILWFNPFVRRQTRRCRMAAELACDAAVTAAQPFQREAYAELILRVLRWGGAIADVVPAANAGDYRLRLEHILRVEPGRTNYDRRLFVALIVAVVPLACVQFAWAQPAGQATFTGMWTDKMLADQDKARADQEASDPAVLHRRVASEPRDEAWATRQEQALQAQLPRFHRPAEITRMTPVVHCGSTLCEIDTRVSFDKAADNFALARSSLALLNFLNHLSSEVPGFENGGTSSVMTPGPDTSRHADIITVNIYTRTGAPASAAGT